MPRKLNLMNKHYNNDDDDEDDDENDDEHDHEDNNDKNINSKMTTKNHEVIKNFSQWVGWIIKEGLK